MKEKILRNKFLHLQILLSAMLTLMTTACEEVPEYRNTPSGNFEALVDIIATRYCFLDKKGIDWDDVAAKYRKGVKPGMSQMELFDLCSDMLDELKDGHVNLSSRFDVSYYRKWWSDYPQDFNLRTLQEYYLGFDYRTVSGMSYKVIAPKTGYIYFPSFSTAVSENSLDLILYFFHLSECETLIIDIRNNGGGLLSNVEVFVARFINESTCGGYIRHKTGPGASDFSSPYEIVYEPAPEGRIKWEGKILLLTNRSCFSAANDFIAVMKSLPQVTVIGARSGGGGGMPFSSELPNGWSIRFSACEINSPEDEYIEEGIDPSAGYEVHCTAEELAAGKDAILDRALSVAATAARTYP